MKSNKMKTKVIEIKIIINLQYSNCHTASWTSTRQNSCIWNVDSSGNRKCYRWYFVDFP